MSEPLRRTDPEAPATSPPPRPIPGRLVLVGRDHALRGEVEAFVEARYEAAFGARPHGHYDLIGALAGADGAVRAAAGVRFAEDEPLFLEQYLDEPVEQALAAAFGRPVARDSVVEIGAFAAVGAESALAVFGGLAAWLGGARGRRFAVATARPELQRLLDRSFPLVPLASADPTRLAGGAGDWGCYYSARPQVLAGAIGRSEALPMLRRRLRQRMMDRQARRLRGSQP